MDQDAEEVKEKKMNRDIYREALEEVHRAEDFFNQADPEYMESACFRLSAARQNLNEVLKEVRSCERD